MAEDQSPPCEIALDLRRHHPFECGAVLLTMMAFPEPMVPERVLSCFNSLCHVAVRNWAEHDAHRAWQMLEHRMVYAFADPAVVKRDLREVQKRLRRRMAAAKMCIPFLRQAITIDPGLPEGIKRVSIAQMAEMVLDESGQNEAKNVPTRVWYPSLPVIHLAVATALVSSELERRGYAPVAFASVLVDPRIIDLIVRNAEELVPYLARSRARIDTDSLIRIRLAA